MNPSDTSVPRRERPCAVILGGYINGYNIIRELHEKGVRDIILIDHTERLASLSNKITRFRRVAKNNATSLFEALLDIHKDFDFLILFPSEDLNLELLASHYDALAEFCFLPFNPRNLKQCSDKRYQYQMCEALGVPYPRTVYVNAASDIDAIRSLPFPVLVKPGTRQDFVSPVFRSLRLMDLQDLERNRQRISDFVTQGQTFLASEIVPGDGSNIYSYMGYRTRDGRILNEWIGRKLSQHPDDFGVFASASNECPDIVAEQGRTLLHGLNLWGIAQPEFKYDRRDGCYKLMEINLRSMMWHRMGNRIGVNIQYTQYRDALGQKVERQGQVRNQIIHFIYLKHELDNLLTRPGYGRIFRHNLFGGDQRTFAVFDLHDWRPFLHDLRVCLRSSCNTVVSQKILWPLARILGLNNRLKALHQRKGNT